MFRDPSAVASAAGRSKEARELCAPSEADSCRQSRDGSATAVRTGQPAELESCDGGQLLHGTADRGAEIQSRLDRVREHLDVADRELAAIASDMISVTTMPEGMCRAEWAACAHCLGSALESSAGTSWCPSCGRPGTGSGDSDAYLCSDRATVTFRDTSGAERSTCLSHAAAAFQHIGGLTLVQAEESDVRALFSVLHTPLRINMSGREPQAVTPVPGRTR